MYTIRSRRNAKSVKSLKIYPGIREGWPDEVDEPIYNHNIQRYVDLASWLLAIFSYLLAVNDISETFSLIIRSPKEPDLHISGCPSCVYSCGQ